MNKKISIVFIDPPYKVNPFEQVLNNIYKSKILSKNAIIILECSKQLKIKIPPHFSSFSERNYRKTKIFFLVSNLNKTS